MAPGSSLTLIRNPPFIVANGGVSVITAIVTEPAGTFVPDGSVVLFFTTLGRIDSQGKTVNGVARVNLVADSRSGRAEITGFASGGDAPAPAPSGTPGQQPPPTTGSGGSGAQTTFVDIGSALPDAIVVTASPPSVRGGGSSLITVNVFDAAGNPVAHVPVNFSLSNSVPGTRLESGGSQRFTDSNGQAFDTLRTGAVLTGGTVTITATAAGFLTGDVQITVTL
jgi:hypothetical protein